MKHTLITIIIALFTCTGGYYVGKNDLLSKLSLPTVESSAESDHRYSAKTIIQINPYGKKTSALGPSSQQSGMITRQFFQTQFAVIRSEDTINKAINDYRLDELFETDKTSLLESIKINLEASQERGTDLIVVKASSDTEEKAKKICYVIVKSYDQRRRDKINETRNEVKA